MPAALDASGTANARRRQNRLALASYGWHSPTNRAANDEISIPPVVLSMRTEG